jgi:hypothetical protein
VLNQAAHPYSAAATGKLHYYLIEGELIRPIKAGSHYHPGAPPGDAKQQQQQQQQQQL